MNTKELELAVVSFINPQQHLIVPNVHWGFLIHECDLFVLTKSGYAWEIELKVTKSDLIKDREKKHKHNDKRIKYLYFAIPDYLEEYIEYIPKRAGIIVVNTKTTKRFCRIIRKPMTNSNSYKFSDKEKFQIARLGALRIWGLKHKILKSKNK